MTIFHFTVAVILATVEVTLGEKWSKMLARYMICTPRRGHVWADEHRYGVREECFICGLNRGEG
jgi:hypothetical protein